MSESKKIPTSSKDKKYVAKELLDYRKVEGQEQYLVHWGGKFEDSIHNTWERADGISSDLIDAYEKRRWQYRADGKTISDIVWRDFSDEHSDRVNAEFIRYQKDPGSHLSHILFDRPGKRTYTYRVDFTKMTQTNTTHSDHTTRKLRRVAWKACIDTTS